MTEFRCSGCDQLSYRGRYEKRKFGSKVVEVKVCLACSNGGV